VNATTAHCSAERDCAQLVAGLNVLVAEDDADGAESMAVTLERAGHNVRVVYDGQSAVASALIDPPDVLIVDVDLRRLNGSSVARRIRDGLRGRPCLLVAVSGLDLPGDRVRARRAGIDRYLTKPFAPGALAALVERECPNVR
jgi:DNA-binding response OmpR family regulator